VEVRKLIDAALQAARSILDAHRAQLDVLADALMQRETLVSEEISRLLGDSSSSNPGRYP
jgi:ATP-dependent Zn protease